MADNCFAMNVENAILMNQVGITDQVGLANFTNKNIAIQTDLIAHYKNVVDADQQNMHNINEKKVDKKYSDQQKNNDMMEAQAQMGIDTKNADNVTGIAQNQVSTTETGITTLQHSISDWNDQFGRVLQNLNSVFDMLRGLGG